MVQVVVSNVTSTATSHDAMAIRSEFTPRNDAITGADLVPMAHDGPGAAWVSLSPGRMMVPLSLGLNRTCLPTLIKYLGACSPRYRSSHTLTRYLIVAVGEFVDLCSAMRPQIWPTKIQIG